MTGERPDLAWRKSSYSDEKDNCVEVAHAAETIMVRDSKNPQAGTLRLATPAWHTFLARVS